MSSTDGKGYLIPVDVQPDDMGCILVFYPQDAENYYLRALLGSLSYLGTWTAWERDPDHRGRLAAKVWKDANDCTLDSMSCITDLVTVLQEIRDAILSQQISLDAGELVTAVNSVATAIDNQQITFDPSGLLPALTGIEEAIEGIECGGQNEEDMQIINNVCCCGSGTGSGTNPDDGLPPDIPQDDLPLLPPPDDDDNYNPEEYPVSDAVCAGVHWVLTQWRNFCISIANGEVTRLNFVTRANITLPGNLGGMTGLDWAISAQQLLLGVSLYLLGLSGRGGDAAREIDNKFEILKCIALQLVASSEKAAQGKVIIDTMSLPYALKAIMKTLWQFLPFQALATTPTAYDNLLPAWAFAPGCPPCVRGGGGETPINLGVWQVEGSSGHCEVTSTASQAEWNTATRYYQNVRLSKTSSSGSYQWNLSRNGNIGSDANYIKVNLRQFGSTKAFTLSFMDSVGTVLRSLPLSADTDQEVIIQNEAWFASVAAVSFNRAGDIYTASCPRIFLFELDIIAPGSSTWENITM